MQGSRREIEALTGLRALAAFWVLGFHLKADLMAALPQGAVFIETVFGHGYLGVDLFFILSGFIISYNYAHWFRSFEPWRYLRFLWARFSRLYPVHLCALLVLGAFILLAPGGEQTQVSPPDRYSLGRWLQSAAMLHGWSFPIWRSWNVPSWSVSSEWFAYLLFPIAASASATIRSTGAALLAMALLVGFLALCFLAVDLPGLMVYGLPRILLEFPIGCLLYLLYRRGTSPLALLGLLLPALAVFVLLRLWGPELGLSRIDDLTSIILGPCLFATLIYGLACGWGSALAHWLGRPVMRYWGRVSYSLYVFHFVIIIVAHHYMPIADLAALPLSLRLAEVTGTLAAILLTAVLSYHFIEEPSRRRMRRLWPRETEAMGDGSNRVVFQEDSSSADSLLVRKGRKTRGAEIKS